MHGLPHNFQPDYRQNFLTSLELPSIGSRTSSRNKLSSNKGKTRENNPTFSGPQHLRTSSKQIAEQKTHFQRPKKTLPQLQQKLQTKSCAMQTAQKKFTKNLANGMFSLKDWKLFWCKLETTARVHTFTRSNVYSNERRRTFALFLGFSRVIWSSPPTSVFFQNCEVGWLDTNCGGLYAKVAFWDGGGHSIGYIENISLWMWLS